MSQAVEIAILHIVWIENTDQWFFMNIFGIAVSSVN